MHDRAAGREVDQAMEGLPSSTQTPDPTFGRRDRERRQQQECERAHQDERALRDIAKHRVPVEELIEHDVRREVQRGVEEREEPEHAPVLDHDVPSRHPTDWCDGERDEQELQRPAACLKLDRFSRIGAKRAVQQAPREPRDRREREHEKQHLADSTHTSGFSKLERPHLGAQAVGAA